MEFSKPSPLYWYVHSQKTLSARLSLFCGTFGKLQMINTSKENLGLIFMFTRLQHLINKPILPPGKTITIPQPLRTKTTGPQVSWLTHMLVEIGPEGGRRHNSPLKTLPSSEGDTAGGRLGDRRNALLYLLPSLSRLRLPYNHFYL
jgi:hypothetical protein